MCILGIDVIIPPRSTPVLDRPEVCIRPHFPSSTMPEPAPAYDTVPADGREALERLHAVVRAGHAIVGGGAGTGISAKFIEQGGADLLVIYNSGRYRMAGRGSLAGLMPYVRAPVSVRRLRRTLSAAAGDRGMRTTSCSRWCVPLAGSALDGGCVLMRHQANEVLPVVHHTPVLAGVCASDPFRNIPRFLRQLKDLGLIGVQVHPFSSKVPSLTQTHSTELPYVGPTDLRRAAAD